MFNGSIPINAQQNYKLILVHVPEYSVQVVFFCIPMASSVSNASSASQSKDCEENSSKEIVSDSKSAGTPLVVSHQPASDSNKQQTVQLILAQPASASASALQGPVSAAGRPPVVIASVSPASDQTKKSSLVAKLTQSGGEHLTGGQVAKICASTPPQMNNVVVGAGSGKPKAFASMMSDNTPTTASPKKQTSAKKGVLHVNLL